MTGRLAGKVAVITGGAEGIGRATAELFIAEGAKVVIGDIQDDPGADLEALHPGALVFAHADVAVESDVEALVAAAVHAFGRVDVMFNNGAAAGDRARIDELTSEGFERTLRLVTGSVLAGHKYAARQFDKQGTGGAIVSTASVASLQGSWAPAAYTIAKHAVMGIVRAATSELAQRGIRSNAIAPGSIMTPGSARVLGVPPDRVGDFLEYMEWRTAGLQPVPRGGRASDIAKAALFLASDDSEWISGILLPVDGGATAIALGGGAPTGLPGVVTGLEQAVTDYFAR